MDFTFKTYEKLLNSLLTRGFSFLTFAQYIEAKAETKVKMDSSSQPMSRAEPRDQPHPNSPSTSPLTSSQPTSNPQSRKTRNLEFQSFSGIHDRRSGPQTPNTEHQTPQQINKEQINNFESLNSLVPRAERFGIESLNYIILRHDVESRYANALQMAQIEHCFGIKGSYYFRFSPKAGNEAIIKKITALGHEIGYHYDDLTVCKGDHQKALERFKKNLDYLRQFAPVRTITMEGAPLSRFDNRVLWKQTPTQQTLYSLNIESLNLESLNSESINPLSTVHYSLFSIIAEPYFDLNFNQIFYLTDTGRCWDGHRYNLRDKATKENPVTNPHFLKLRYHTTFDLINAIEATFPQQINKEQINEFSNPESLNFESFPKQAMLNFHPQRWNDKPLPWLKELLLQNIKNQGKRLLLYVRKSQ